jgi:hypothetical protein
MILTVQIWMFWCRLLRAGSRAFAFGVTIALRRQVLAGIGGFAALASQLADTFSRDPRRRGAAGGENHRMTAAACGT